MHLSTHFRLEEFEFSEAATRHGIDNHVPERLIPNLGRLIGVLEQVRQLCGGAPMRITSGYRGGELNRLVRGSDHSAHLDCRAADFQIPAFATPLEICERIAASPIHFDQLIHEFGAWVHVSIARENVEPRRQLLTIDRTGTRAGLHRVLA